MQEPKRLSLANLPTPLVRLDRLGRMLGDAQIWMKRDDLTGLELSGNKVRKLEYIAADALSRGCDTLVTEGTCQSNHCRAHMLLTLPGPCRCRAASSADSLPIASTLPTDLYRPPALGRTKISNGRCGPSSALGAYSASVPAIAVRGIARTLTHSWSWP